MISEELLSEVLNDYNIEHFEIVAEYLWIQKDGGYMNKTISIYKLAYECKEWAYSKGYVLKSTIRTRTSLAICEFSISGIHDYEDDLWSNFRAETEQEAIFKACQWILERISNDQ